MTTAAFIQTLVDAASNKQDLRAAVVASIGDLAQFMRALDAQLAQAPLDFAAADSDYAAYLAALPLPAIPGATP
jgi:hypothetical protein